MTLTNHGHHIPDSPDSDEPEERVRARCGGPAFCSKCKDEVLAYHFVKPPTEVKDPNSGVGWYEFIHPAKSTTHIAYVAEDGHMYIPEIGVVTHEDFAVAAVRGKAYRLVRADNI